MLEALQSFASNNPLLCVAFLYLAWKYYQSRRPWPDYGGNVTSVHDFAEWQALQAQSGQSGTLLLVDCYATWCPPCKAAAPVFARMSEEYSNCTFAKVNVDHAKAVSSALGITAMPTFKLFRGSSELAVCRGWDEPKVREMLSSHGALSSSASKTKDS
mmetsp:Transcript_41124/g.68362  ORF Transcript_41124/g.68362 Transcript_41124/m.68362 type:complete len:158 (-) Transcript_41124:233-706(-)